MSDHEYEVEMRNISKSFEGVKALQKVNLSVKPGEIHALVGENGAGISTRIRIRAGALQADSGEIFLKGKKAEIKNSKDGIENSISVIYQEFALVPHLSVAENIFIDEFDTKYIRINWKDLWRRARESLTAIGFGDINVKSPVMDLPIAYQQVVEICKALNRNASILVLDEPTAVLTLREVDQLFILLKNLSERGVTIIYISHRLEEIFRITNRITVLKDGHYVATVNTTDIEPKALVNMMIGRNLNSFFPERETSHIGNIILRVENIRAGKAVKDVSFSVREGEVTGLSGLVGAGRTEAVRAILGIDKLEGGRIFYQNEEIRLKSVEDAFARGIGFLPEDRKNQGVLLRMSIKHNITLSCIKRFTTLFGWLLSLKETIFAEEMRSKLDIKTANLNNNVDSLSGGNQQKVAIARILASNSRMLILDEPTRGVDVGAKMEIFKLINELVAQNYAILIISSEMEEIIGMCDRTVVIKDGKSVGELQKNELTEENIIHYAMGV
ncbi:MAG: sugar ABC transporter ATP-binding protein [Treponema sp.]|nr:sugar ABC transporter ATP-binding protein [Treponema sp.]